MERLSIYEYKKLLESANYNINPDKLKILTERLSHDKHYDLSLIKDDLVVKGYDASIQSDDKNQYILDIYLGFAGLQFIINENNKLVLIEEMWYQKGCCCDRCYVIIGEPSVDNIIKIIDLYCTNGRSSNCDHPSIGHLLNR
jgi:hypothetical protein